MSSSSSSLDGSDTAASAASTAFWQSSLYSSYKRLETYWEIKQFNVDGPSSWHVHMPRPRVFLPVSVLRRMQPKTRLVGRQSS